MKRLGTARGHNVETLNELYKNRAISKVHAVQAYVACTLDGNDVTQMLFPQ